MPHERFENLPEDEESLLAEMLDQHDDLFDPESYGLGRQAG